MSESTYPATADAADAIDTSQRRRSPGLAVLGILALMLAGWGLADGPRIADPSIGPWVILAVGVVVGLGLVASGFRRR